MVEKEDKKEVVKIAGISVRSFRLSIKGTSPLISHKFSDRALDAILSKQMRTAIKSPGRAIKDPQKDFEESLYVLKDGRYGFPVSGFKKAAVDGCSFIPEMKKTFARGAFHIVDEHEGLVVIEGTPRKRMDNVRVGRGADIRYRAEFPIGWKAKLLIRYNENAISIPQICQIFNAGGFGVGVGDWRPQKAGSYGMFEVDGDGN